MAKGSRSGNSTVTRGLPKQPAGNRAGNARKPAGVLPSGFASDVLSDNPVGQRTATPKTGIPMAGDTAIGGGKPAAASPSVARDAAAIRDALSAPIFDSQVTISEDGGW